MSKPTSQPGPPAPLPRLRSEERVCRFCNEQLPDWRSAPPVPLPAAASATGAAEAPPAYMRISYGGRRCEARRVACANKH